MVEVELQDYIKSLDSLPLAAKFKALKNLVAGLKAEPHEEYGYLVKHENYKGIGNLADVAILWADCENVWKTEHGPFRLRLLDKFMDPSYKIYDVLRDDGRIRYADPVENENVDNSVCNVDPKERCLACEALKNKGTVQVEEGKAIVIWGT